MLKSSKNLCVKSKQYLLFIKFYNGALFLCTLGHDTEKVLHSNDDQERVYQNCKFYDPRAGVLVLRFWHINHMMKMHCVFKEFPSLFWGMIQTN